MYFTIKRNSERSDECIDFTMMCFEFIQNMSKLRKFANLKYIFYAFYLIETSAKRDANGIDFYLKLSVGLAYVWAPGTDGISLDKRCNGVIIVLIKQRLCDQIPNPRKSNASLQIMRIFGYGKQSPLMWQNEYSWRIIEVKSQKEGQVPYLAPPNGQVRACSAYFIKQKNKTINPVVSMSPIIKEILLSTRENIVSQPLGKDKICVTYNFLKFAVYLINKRYGGKMTHKPNKHFYNVLENAINTINLKNIDGKSSELCEIR
ncbi:hypothetical protein AGLY_008076 [Aphis glycines]|uniref:Uncharacterized protein n=1 Tax=Aphis glycines TaxID=307491 RepID=A0A6G0TLN7_APHGL|nr:hypothetical protein AGLY_008076 [Aphis glycines]